MIGISYSYIREITRGNKFVNISSRDRLEGSCDQTTIESLHLLV